MKREEMLKEMERAGQWDVLIIGGGATGLGAAVDAASRGYRTLLLEQADFAKGSSSRSTKLIHGGLRYLQQGNVSLVMEALHERGILFRNAPHMIHHLPFLVPHYQIWERPFYGIGLKIYDHLAGKWGIERSFHLSKQEALEMIPTLEPHHLRGGNIYYDGQFDDARLAICLAHTAHDHGALLLNYCKVKSLIKKDGICVGVRAEDQETHTEYEIRARTVINATGVFSDEMLQLDDDQTQKIIAPSQGIHLVLDRSFLPGHTALLVPRTADKRVLFLIPWNDRVLLGTTDTPVDAPSLEPEARPQEIDFLLAHAAKYLSKEPTREDVLSIFAGLRPLVKSGTSGKKGKTSSLSRDHAIFVSSSHLVTIAGGKWTTYRKMGEDVVNAAAQVGKLSARTCVTQTLTLHGYAEENPYSHLGLYGTDAQKIQALCRQEPALAQTLHPNLPYIRAEILFAIREEMARTVEDLLSRRTRALLLDAAASIEMAPEVAQLLARELNKDESWEKNQTLEYSALAKHSLV